MATDLGVKFLLKIGGNPVGAQKNATINLSREMKERHTKADFPNKKFRYGNLSGSISCDGLYEFGDTAQAAIKAAQAAGTEVEWDFTTDEAGQYHFSGTGFITQNDRNMSVGDDATFSLTVTTSGAIAFAAVTE